MPPDPSCLKVFAVPELVDLIHLGFLRHDLVHCTRVCKIFLEAFTPVLWHTVSIKTLHQHQVFTTSLEIQEALSRNCAHIRIIRLQSCKSLEPFFRIDNASLQRLRVHTLEFPWPESIPHRCIISVNMNLVPDQEQSLRSLQEGFDLDSILEPTEPIDPELCTISQRLAEGHPRDWLRDPRAFLMQQQIQGCNERLHRYLRHKHSETEQYALDAQNWLKKYPSRSRSASGTFPPPPPPPLLLNELQFVLRIIAYSTLTQSLDISLRKRAIIILILQVSSLQVYQQHLDGLSASASNSEPTFRDIQQLIQGDAAERDRITPTPGRMCLDMQQETQRQLYMEIQYRQNNELFQARPELPVNPLQAQICFQSQQQLSLVLHQQTAALNDKEQKFHVLQKLIRQLQLQCQEGDHWRLSALTELPQELMRLLRELLQELSLEPEEGALKELAEGFENLAQTRSNNKEDYIELYTTKISHIQGWITSHKIHRQSAQLLTTPSSLHHDVEEGVDSAPPSPPTFTRLVPRFIDSYRFALVDTSGSDIPWDKDALEDEQLLIQFLKLLPGDSLRVFSSNKFSFRNRSLSELLISSAEHLPGLSCLSMYRNDASVVNSQLMASNWYQEDSPCADPFTEEIDWFLQRCPVQLQTLRIAIAGFLEPMHERMAEQRRRATRNKTPLKLSRTAIKHLYLEGNLALSSQPEFLERCPNLQSLSLSCSKSSPVLHLAPMIVHCPKIEDLAISSPTRPDDDMTQCVAAFLRACAPSSTSPSSSSLPSKMERTGLKRLRLENLKATQDRILEALQLCGPTLTHLAIRDCRLPMTLRPQSATETPPSPFSFNRILETFTQLQELDIMCTPKFIHLQPTRPRSVMLHGKFDAQHLVEDLKPLTRNDAPGDIPHKAWACSQTLTVLRIEISGIHRAPPPCTRLPDTHAYFACTTFNISSSTSPASLGPASFPVTTTTTPAAATQREVAGPDPEQIKEGYRLQREVCLLLGTLSSLEELCLGALNVPGDDRPPALPGLARWRGGFYSTAAGIQTQCLELSLSTGLELMCGMKEMRVLKVGGLEHRIGLGEIQWMCEHWPKLEAVYGLLRVKNREQYDPDWEGKEEDDETERETVNWIRKNRPHLRYT